jgi:hypothetical protein
MLSPGASKLAGEVRSEWCCSSKFLCAQTRWSGADRRVRPPSRAENPLRIPVQPRSIGTGASHYSVLLIASGTSKHFEVALDGYFWYKLLPESCCTPATSTAENPDLRINSGQKSLKNTQTFYFPQPLKAAINTA